MQTAAALWIVIWIVHFTLTNIAKILYMYICNAHCMHKSCKHYGCLILASAQSTYVSLTFTFWHPHDTINQLINHPLCLCYYHSDHGHDLLSISWVLYLVCNNEWSLQNRIPKFSHSCKASESYSNTWGIVCWPGTWTKFSLNHVSTQYK